MIFFVLLFSFVLEGYFAIAFRNTDSLLKTLTYENAGTTLQTQSVGGAHCEQHTVLCVDIHSDHHHHGPCNSLHGLKTFQGHCALCAKS